MGLMLAGLYFFMTRGQRKEEKRRKDMMGDLKKGDRVMTIGGMLASVVSVDDDRVVLKIDESNNVKATYRKSAIQEVIDRDDKK
jgi:preprotein translocase subunit YajC